MFGEVDGGAFAEYVAAPADWLVAKPHGSSFEEAATLGIAAETALQGLRDWGRLHEGQRVLVNGASGGVGTLRGPDRQGARRRPRHRRVQHRQRRDRGAHRRRPRRRLHPGGPQPVGERYDLVFDNAGVWPLRSCSRMLTDGGSYVMVTSPKTRWLHPLPRMIASPLYFAIAPRPGPASRSRPATPPTSSSCATWSSRVS